MGRSVHVHVGKATDRISGQDRGRHVQSADMFVFSPLHVRHAASATLLERSVNEKHSAPGAFQLQRSHGSLNLRRHFAIQCTRVLQGRKAQNQTAHVPSVQFGSVSPLWLSQVTTT